MKKTFFILSLLIGLHASAQKKKPTHFFKSFKTYVTDLNNDGIPDTIRLSSSSKEKDEFKRITISLTGFGEQTFIAKESWAIVDTAFLLNNKNEINSKFIFFKRNPLHSVILLFGTQDGDGYREEFSIINIENNNIKMVFDDVEDQDVELPNKLTDLDNNGRLDFVYRIMFEFSRQLKDGDIGSYRPYFVYTISDTCNLNKLLMKQYNQQKYVFAGYQYSESINIFYPHNKSKKPRIWKN